MSVVKQIRDMIFNVELKLCVPMVRSEWVICIEKNVYDDLRFEVNHINSVKIHTVIQDWKDIEKFEGVEVAIIPGMIDGPICLRRKT